MALKHCTTSRMASQYQAADASTPRFTKLHSAITQPKGVLFPDIIRCHRPSLLAPQVPGILAGRALAPTPYPSELH